MRARCTDKCDCCSACFQCLRTSLYGQQSRKNLLFRNHVLVQRINVLIVQFSSISYLTSSNNLVKWFVKNASLAHERHPAKCKENLLSLWLQLKEETNRIACYLFTIVCLAVHRWSSSTFRRHYSGYSSRQYRRAFRIFIYHHSSTKCKSRPKVNNKHSKTKRRYAIIYTWIDV